jgi:hypothetical protein
MEIASDGDEYHQSILYVGMNKALMKPTKN